MSTPADPPYQLPPRATSADKKTRLRGAVVAIGAVALVSLLVGVVDNSSSGLFVAPMMSFGCVFLGSILTIFERTHQFAVGFLIASAGLIFVTAGVCTVATVATL